MNKLLSAVVLLCLGAGAQAQTTQYATTQYAYDAAGNLTQVTDPRGLVTKFSYDALGRRTQVQGPPAAAGGAAPLTVFNYDGQDRVTKVTDPRSLVTAYTVDGLGNTTAQQSPDTGTTNATYDAAGNLITRTDARGKITTYTYDAVNRLIRATYASGTPTVIEYDGGTSPLPNDIGRLTKLTDESGSTRFQYDGFGNQLQKAQTSTANGVTVTQTVAYAYGTSGNTNGKRISQTYPSGNVIGYSYDAGGRIAGLTLTSPKGNTTLLSNIQYQPFGKPTGWTWGNGTAYTRSFDLNGRLTQFPLGATTGTGATPNGLSRTVNYDVASRITAYTHTDTTGSPSSSTATAANQTFGYDDNDRLISYLPATSSQSYSYDANGNRTGQTVGSSSYSQTIDPASNRQTASTGPTPATNSYDTAGNQTADGATTYSYSDRGRLASVTKAGTTTSYLYNGLGQRVTKQGTNVPTGATRYAYDDAGHLIGEYDQAGNALQETVYLGDTPIATIKNQTAYYVYADQIDTPRVITDTANLMVWRWDQADPFGAAAPDENPTSLGAFAYNLRFPGQVYDQETGKHYNVNRDYDPSAGRYAQSDPIGLNGGQPSTYSYVGGNPLRFVDPRGLDWKDSINNWWNASVSGFQSENALEFAQRILEGMPQDAALLGALGTIRRAAKVEQCAAKTIDTAAVRFSQDSVKGAFRNGTTLNEAVDALRAGGAEAAASFPPIRLVEHEGRLFTLDNRRLLVFSQAGQEVPYRMATEVEIAREFASKFSTTVTQGWGQFITVRP